MPNTTIIAIGVVIPLTLLLGGASAFIWSTERRRRNQVHNNISEIPYRPRAASYFYRNKDYPNCIEDGIEVCSPRPSLSKLVVSGVDDKELVEYALPSMQMEEIRQDSAVQSPTDTIETASELEGSLVGTLPVKCPSKAKLRHSSDEHYAHTIARKEVPTRASLQPQDHYKKKRQSLQPLITGHNQPLPPIVTEPIEPLRPIMTDPKDRMMVNRLNKEVLDPESRDGTNSPTVSAISELSTRGRASQRFSDVPSELPAWIKRMSVQEEMAERSWRVDGEMAAMADTSRF